MKKIFLYIISFILVVISISSLIVLVPLLVTTYNTPDFIYILIVFTFDVAILVLCYPVWKEMDEKTTLDLDKKIELLLKSEKTPLNVRSAIHSFEMGTATLDDAIIVAPYGIFYFEIYDILKKQNFSFVKNESKKFFIQYELEDFLQSLEEVRTGKLSSEEAIVALSYELLAPSDTIKILKEHKDDYPKIVEKLSPQNFKKDFSCEDMIELLRKEQKYSKSSKMLKK